MAPRYGRSEERRGEMPPTVGGEKTMQEADNKRRHLIRTPPLSAIPTEEIAMQGSDY